MSSEKFEPATESQMNVFIHFNYDFWLGEN